jgi:hypothetical protein
MFLRGRTKPKRVETEAQKLKREQENIKTRAHKVMKAREC